VVRFTPLGADHPMRRIALVWRTGSPRDKEFHILADALREARGATVEEISLRYAS
jgi:hypothetical protein